MSRDDIKLADYANFIETSNGQPYLTKMGMKVWNDGTRKQEIIRIYSLMHQYSPSAYNLECGDYFYGPAFKGNGFSPNIFKFTIKEWDCNFESVECNEANIKKVRKDIIIDDFAWFKAITGNKLLLLLQFLMSIDPHFI